MAKLISYAEIDSNFVIIDVRTTQEFDELHVEHAYNLPLDFTKDFVDEALQFEKKIVFMCVSGVRAKHAAEFYELSTKKQAYYITQNIYSLVS